MPKSDKVKFESSSHSSVIKLERSEHNISRQFISDNALKVMRHLSKSGFEAFLVGGAVRDLMLGKRPKDFDVATNATPEEIYKLFRNARIIGRRFRIVHILFGREIIEVTTFRGDHNEVECKQSSSTNDQGMLLRDNVFGSIEEDALRRDFTVNALYYSSKDFCVYDFANGIRDLKHRTLRLIGDPAMRFKEDPVRILRAIRFAAKLEFSLDKETEAQIQPHAELLKHIPAARLFDEFTKLFINGHALQTYAELEKHKLLHYLLPSCDLIANDKVSGALIKQALINTDDRLRIGKTVTPTFILAVLLWPALRKTQKSLSAHNLSPMVELHTAAQIIMNEQAAATTLPKLIQIGLKEIWDLQNRLENRTGRRAFKLLEHGKFRAAYDFLLLREEVGEIDSGLGEWWTQFQQQNEIEREESVRNLGASIIHKKKKPRKRKPKSPALNLIENS